MQELPPEGGFPKIQWTRSLPPRGPPGWVLLSCLAATSFGGMFLYARTRNLRIELDREFAQRRLMLLPLILAETDLEWISRREASVQREREVMRDIDPAWDPDASPYHNSRLHVRPTSVL